MADPGDMLCAVAPEGCYFVQPDPHQAELPSIPPGDQHAAGLIFIAIIVAALLMFLPERPH